MTPTVGFILLTHHKPHQTIRLISTLNRMFDFPPIVHHHNFSVSDFPIDILPRNVVLVRPHVEVIWGKYSMIEAMMRALEVMYESQTSPDWFVLLTGADYPIKSASHILHDLSSSSSDVHMYHEQLTYEAYKNAHEEEDMMKVHYERYCSIKFWAPHITKNLRLTKRHIILKHPLLTTPFIP